MIRVGRLILAGFLLAVAAAVASAEEETRVACDMELATPISGDSLRVLSLNASHGRSTAINQVLVSKEAQYRNLDTIANLLAEAEPDVVALQEADAPSLWSGLFDHVAYLAEQASYPCRLQGLHSQTFAASYGTALLSRAPQLEPTSRKFTPSPPTTQKGYVRAQFLWQTPSSTRQLTVVSVHLDFLSQKTRGSQVAEMVADLSQLDGSLIVLGDLNSEWGAKGSQVKRLAEQLDLQAFEPESDDLGTFKNGSRLDWILISDDLQFLRHEIRPEVVADHFAVFAEVGLR